MFAARQFSYRFAYWYGAQMVELGWKRSEIAPDLLRSDPYGPVTRPASAENVFGETRYKISGQFRLLQRERVIGARQDHHRAVRNSHAQRILQRPRRKKIVLAGQDHRRRADRRQLRSKRLKVEERLHQIGQRVNIVDEPSAMRGKLDQITFILEPLAREVHREQQILQISCTAERQPRAHGGAKPVKLRRDFCKAAHRHQPGNAVAMVDGITQRNHPAEAYSGDKDRPVAKRGNELTKHVHLVGLFNEKGRLVRLPLPEHIEARDVETSGHERIAERMPKLDVLREAVNQDAGWTVDRPG